MLAAQNSLVKQYTEYKLKSALEKANNYARAQVSYKNVMQIRTGKPG